MPYKVSDRTFITYTVKLPMILVVPSNSPYKTLNHVIAAVKKDPKAMTWGSLGGTGVSDLLFLRLLIEARTGRLPPGEGDLPLYAFLDALPADEYEVPLKGHDGISAAEKAQLAASQMRNYLAAYNASRGRPDPWQ